MFIVPWQHDTVQKTWHWISINVTLESQQVMSPPWSLSILTGEMQTEPVDEKQSVWEVLSVLKMMMIMTMKPEFCLIPFSWDH